MTISGSPPEYNGYCSFEVGQHVVCVDNKAYRWGWLPGDAPEVGRVYTVDRVGIHPKGTIVIRLQEKRRHPRAQALGFWGYSARRFRPAPSIDALTALLHETPTPVSAEQEHAG